MPFPTPRQTRETQRRTEARSNIDRSNQNIHTYTGLYTGLYNLRIPIRGFAFMLEDETFREPDTALDFDPDGQVTAVEGARRVEG
jgi:hypothetical protein